MILQRNVHSTELPPTIFASANERVVKCVQRAVPGCGRGDFARAAALSDCWIALQTRRCVARFSLMLEKVANLLVEHSPTSLASPQRRSQCILAELQE